MIIKRHFYAVPSKPTPVGSEPTRLLFFGTRVAEEATPVRSAGTPVDFLGAQAAKLVSPVPLEGTPVHAERTRVAKNRTAVAEKRRAVIAGGTPVTIRHSFARWGLPGLAQLRKASYFGWIWAGIGKGVGYI
jgi:hypothetical protein